MSAATSPRFMLRCPYGHESASDAPVTICGACGWGETPDQREAFLRAGRCTRPEPRNDGMRCGERAVARYDVIEENIAVLRCARHDALVLMATHHNPARWRRTVLELRP